MAQGGDDAAQLGEALQAADGRIAGLRLSCQVVQNVLPVIGAYRDRPIRAAGVATASLFGQGGGDDGDHVGIAGQMLCLVERPRDPVAFAPDIAQMQEMHAIAKALHHARKPDAALVRDLRGQLAEQAQVAGKDSVRFIALDERFRRTLAEGAGKSHAWTVVENVKVHMDRVRHLATRRFPMAALVAQHRQVVDAIAQGDGEAAETAMRGHLRTILNDLPEVARHHPEFFEGAE